MVRRDNEGIVSHRLAFHLGREKKSPAEKVFFLLSRVARRGTIRIINRHGFVVSDKYKRSRKTAAGRNSQLVKLFIRAVVTLTTVCRFLLFCRGQMTSPIALRVSYSQIDTVTRVPKSNKTKYT